MNLATKIRLLEGISWFLWLLIIAQLVGAFVAALCFVLKDMGHSERIVWWVHVISPFVIWTMLMYYYDDMKRFYVKLLKVIT